MDSVQKRSLLAILSMIESGIQQLKSLIAGQNEPEERLHGQPKSSQTEQKSYLQDAEEEELERQMELERQRLVQETDRMQELWELDT